MLSVEEKQRILKAIEEDREFRYALMGLLGFKELLERFVKLEERQQKLEEKFAELKERFAKLEERQQKLEEKFQELEERFQRLEERQQKLEERFLELSERTTRLEERIIKVEKLVTTIGERFGVIIESSFREALKGIVSKYFGANVSKLTIYDDEGIVFGYPSVVDIDVVIKDKTHILVEIKSRADPSDVIKLLRVAKLYEKKTGVKPKLAIVAGYVPPKTREVAFKHNIDVYSYLEEKE